MRNGVIGSTADSDSVSRGSSPFSVVGNLNQQIPYFIGVWLSLVERYVRDVEAAGSNPVTPIFVWEAGILMNIRIPVFFYFLLYRFFYKNFFFSQLF